jgi:hypothetical protein
MRHILAAVMCSAVAVTTLACSGDDAGGEGTEQQVGATPAGTGSPETPRPFAKTTGTLTVTPVRAFRGPAAGPIIRGARGDVLVQFRTGTGTRGWYRFYNRRWRPRSPLLQINADLRVAQPTQHGFIGLATAWKGNRRPHLRKWILIRPDGSLRAITRQPSQGDEPLRPRAGDELIPAYWNPQTVYRPAQDRVFLRRMPHRYRRGLNMEPGRPTLCTYYRHGDFIHTSTNAGRTWRATVSDAIPHRPGTVLYGCDTSQTRILVQTGDFDAIRTVHVIDRMTGRLLRTHHYSNREGGSALLLHSGVLVADADRHGILVGTDPSNRVLAYRRGAVTPTTSYWVLGRLLVASSSRWPGSVRVTNDEGRTWRRVSLRLPPLVGPPGG